MQSRTVCAILPVTDTKHIKLAKKVVDLFVKQHFLPIELIVVNNSSDAVINRGIEHLLPEGIKLREINNVPINANKSQLYNIGIMSTEAEWILPLTVNSYTHPGRLLYQLAHTPDNAVSYLRYRLCIDIRRIDEHNETGFVPDIFFETNPGATMLFPRICDGEIMLYDDRIGHNEGVELYARLSQVVSTVSIDNTHTLFVQGLNWPVLSINFIHSLFPVDDIPKQTDEMIKLKQALNMHDYSFLYSVLSSFGFQVKNGLV